MNIQDLVLHAGAFLSYVIIFAIFFAECGLFFGFFLPGDTLLFGLGLAATTGFPNIWLLLIVACVAAITGVLVGYAFGRRYGPPLFKRDDSLFFKRRYIDQAEAFYEKYGKATIVLCRFVPVVRTFAPIVAGIARMDYAVFALYTVVGGVAWVTLMVSLGYFLGHAIPNIDRYILPIVGLAVVVPLAGSVLSIISEAVNRRRKR